MTICCLVIAEGAYYSPSKLPPVECRRRRKRSRDQRKLVSAGKACLAALDQRRLVTSGAGCDCFFRCFVCCFTAIDMVVFL